MDSAYVTTALSPLKLPVRQVEENNICTREDRNKLHLVSSPSLREERLQHIDLEPADTSAALLPAGERTKTHTAIAMTPKLSNVAYQNNRLRDAGKTTEPAA